MIDSPRTILSVSPSDRFSITGPHCDAAHQAIEIWFRHDSRDGIPGSPLESLSELPVRIEIETVPLRHAGFGTGTQLALCAVMSVLRCLGSKTTGPDELAALTGRGKRSGIGTYGFFQGGFIVDRGKTEGDSLAPLDFRTNFPTHWSIVTVIHTASIGLSGNQELKAFQRITPSSESERNDMIEIVRRQMIPGILQENYDLFAEGVFEFGRSSGMMFSSIQHGPYNGPHVEALVDEIREWGVKAVGQSSWGPCIFAIVRNRKLADELVTFLKNRHEHDYLINVTRSDNRGARIVDE